MDKIRKHLVQLLEGGQSYRPIKTQIMGIPLALAGKRVAAVPFTLYQLLAHIQIAQRDILNFCVDENYVAPPWPKGYWPTHMAPATQESWQACVDGILGDLETMKQLVQDPSIDLLRPIPWGDGQTLFREVMLVAEHNAYHAGQVVMLRRFLGIWND